MFTPLRETFAHTMNRMGLGAALSLVFLLSAPLWVQSTARAEVIITEIMANPETGTEWIELSTKGEETENISNFRLYDVVSSPSLLFSFPENTLLTSGTATVIEINPAKLNNSGDGITLYDPENNKLVEVTFGDSTKGMSWQRTLESATYFQELPTPGAIVTTAPASPLPSPTSTPLPSPSPTPTPVTQSSANLPPEVAQPPQTHSVTTAQQTELEAKITSLLAGYSLRSHNFLDRSSPQPATGSAERKTVTRKRDFVPPQSSAVSFMGGGILISSASYLALYVLEQKEITF